MSPADKRAVIGQIAAEVGFDRLGVARAGTVPRADYLRDWVAHGRGGRMDYLARNLDVRTDPRRLLDDARSVIVVALNYEQPTPSRPDDQPRGQVAKYAWGDDYHQVVRDRLRLMIARMRSRLDEPFATRACVDTAPILEREWAAAAGLGWIGKNTMVLNDRIGSYFFLAEIVTTLDLEPDDPLPDHCGSCTRCLEACPTDALTGPYEMDARRCISYLTIELRDEIPPEYHRDMGEWIFGCDICQQVCPFNRDAPATGAFAIHAPTPFPSLADILAWDEADYARHLRGSALKRARLTMLKRNATVALANRTAPVRTSD
ncbi:MAG: tRNA epoxyqueuosine(34) reductase QueG [bacterium]|nr:tRNA epoxyqueuosine(34) reductase QueG [bacterium]